jgi:ribosomal protein S18 acetylase RimI-like enzyme
VIVRLLGDGDTDALLALQHARAGLDSQWSREHLDDTLRDPARGSGVNVRVAVDHGRVAGAVGWVRGDVEFFAAPFLAADAAAARTLIDLSLLQARGASWIRISVGERDSEVTEVLRDRGFTLHSEMIELARATEDIASDLATTPVADADRGELLALYNSTFRDVPNALPIDREELDAFIASSFAAASCVIPGGFLIARDHGSHAEIYVTGVDAAHRGRGLGRAMVMRAVGASFRAGLPEIRASVSSLNAASIELHTRCGFAPKFRRFVWQRELV